MPNIRSAKKAMRQAETRRTRNRGQRSALRTAIKKVRQAPDKESAEKALAIAERMLDRAAGKHLLHRNAAARQKARLVKAARSKS